MPLWSLCSADHLILPAVAPKAVVLYFPGWVMKKCFHFTNVDIVEIKTKIHFLAYSVGVMAAYATHPPHLTIDQYGTVRLCVFIAPPQMVLNAHGVLYLHCQAFHQCQTGSFSF